MDEVAPVRFAHLTGVTSHAMMGEVVPRLSGTETFLGISELPHPYINVNAAHSGLRPAAMVHQY